MNVTSLIQQRQYGGLGRKKNCHRQIEEYVEGNVSTKFVNKACAMPGRCRSTFVMEFSPDGTKVASTHGDHSVRVSEIATGKCVKTLNGHPRTPWCLAYHPSSSHILASGCLHGEVRIWDLYGHGCEVWQTENTTVIASLTFHPIDHVLVIAAGNTLYFWDWSKPEPFAKCSTAYEFERIRWVKFDSLGNNLYTGISNNTSIHRENVANSANQSEDRSQGTPSRLGSLYNNIVNCFHEYQRDRMIHQQNLHPHWRQRSRTQFRTGNDPFVGVGPLLSDQERARSPLTVAGTDTDLDSHQSIVRQNELLMGSYSELLAQRSRAHSSRREQNPRTHLNTEFLINPTSDPFLSDVPPPSDFIDLPSGETERVPVLDTEQGASSGSDPVVRGMYSPPPAPARSSLVENLLTGEDNLLRETQNVERSGSDISAIPRVETSASLDSANGTVQDDCETLAVSVCDRTQDTGASSGAVACDNRRSSSSALGHTSEATNPRPTLTSYLRNQTTSQTFRSIRDRLQTSIPLSLDSGSGTSGGPVRVISSRELSVPQVTVISGTDLDANPSIVNSRREYNSVIYPSVTTNDGVLNQSSSFGQFSSRLLSRLVHGQDTTQTVSDSNCDNHGSVDQVGRSTQSVSVSESTPRLSSAVRSHSSLFHNTYPRRSTSNGSRYSSTDSGYRLISARPQPYHWQSRASGSHLPLMGPYLESRGIRTGSYGSLLEQIPSTRSSESIPFLPSRVSYFTSTAQQTQTTTRDSQTSSDTESEISSHLTHSGAYFMPIRNEPSRMGSSTSSCSTSSVDRNSNPPVSSVENFTDSTAGQSSRSSSQSQGHEVELTLDQNDNYSASQMPNANIVNRNEIRHETQDDNNNSIHIVQPEVNSQLQVPLPGQSGHSRQNVLANIHTAMSTCSSVLPTTASFVPPSTVTVLSSSMVSSSSLSVQSTSVVSSTCVTLPSTVTSSGQPCNRDYVSLRNTFVNMTSQIEREMSDLNRRINALRDSFNESLLALRQDRQRYENLGNLLEETASGLPPIPTVLESSEEQQTPPEITVTQPREPGGIEQPINTEAGPSASALSQPLTLLESSLRSHRWNRQTANIHDSVSAQEASGSERELGQGDTHSWRSLQRHYLHPHYSSSILDETINRPNNAIQSAINRAIAGAFMGTGEAAVANNIINQTHRIQHWDFRKCDIPDITSSTENVLVPHCKLHNSASCDISLDCSLLATFVPSHQGFPDDNILTVYSLRPESRGQCLFTKSFGPNAISISISPKNNHVLVGLAAKRLSWVFTSDQLVAQVYRLEKEGAGEKSMKHVKDVMHSCNMGIRSHVSGNSARWLPRPGQGIVYGTNRGDLHLCRPGVKVVVEKTNKPDGQRSSDLTDSTGNIRRCLLGRVPWLNYANPDRISTSTQTHGIRRTTSTQTEQEEQDNVVWL